MGRSEIELDLPALEIAAGQKVDVHLVGAKLRAAMADFSQIERLCIVRCAADVQDRAPAELVVVDQEVNRFWKLRAPDQAENGMYVSFARHTRPELELLGRQLL